MILLVLILLFAVIYQTYLFFRERKYYRLVKAIKEKIILKKLSIISILCIVVEVAASTVFIIYVSLTLGYNKLLHPNPIIHIAQFEFTAGILLIAFFTLSKFYIVIDFILDQSSFYKVLVSYYILHTFYFFSQTFSIDFRISLFDTWLKYNHKNIFEVGFNILSLIILFFIIWERREQRKKNIFNR